MAYGGIGSNIKLISLTDANAWRDVLGWDVNESGAEIDTQLAHATVGWVNRCVHLRASALATLPWSLMKGENKITDSEDSEFDAIPWLESLSDFLYLSEAALCIAGKAFIGKIRTRGKQIDSLRWFAPSTMTPVWSPAFGLTSYERKIGAEAKTWAVNDIVYFCTPNPMHETEPGVSPVAAALLDAQIIYNLNQYSSIFFQRGAIKPTLLTVEGMPLVAERERLKAWWQRAFNGVKNAFNTEVISASVKPVVIGEGLSELNNNALTQEKREAISTALGVPHSMVMSNASNFATATADRLNLFDTTVVPQANFIAKQLNNQLFKDLGYRLVFRPESLSIYQEDEEQRAGALQAYVGAGMPLSIAAEILGVKLPDGVTYQSLDEAKRKEREQQNALVDSRLSQLQNGDSAHDEQNTDKPNEEKPDANAKAAELAQFRKWLKKRPNADIHTFKASHLSHDELHEIAENIRGVATEQPFFTLPETFTHESVKALILQLDPDDDEAELKLRLEIEKRAMRNIDKAFTDMINTLYPEGYGSTGAFIDPNIEANRIHNAFVRDQQLKDAIDRALIDSVDLGVSVGFMQLENIGIGFDYTLAHYAGRDWAATYTPQLLEQMGVTSGKLAGQAVVRWFENGEGFASLISDLEPVFGKKRASRIAVTEVTRAAAEGHLAAYRESGVVKKTVWRTARDERVCKICGPLEGRYGTLDGDFNGVRCPAHVNCRCGVSPVVD